MEERAQHLVMSKGSAVLVAACPSRPRMIWSAPVSGLSTNGTRGWSPPCNRLNG
jgi:hypothetical protein